MDLNKAERLARRLMGKHGLSEWLFVWRDNWKSVFGACNRTRRIIYLSRPLTELNSENEVKDTARDRTCPHSIRQSPWQGVEAHR